jgi:hypothetical protein
VKTGSETPGKEGSAKQTQVMFLGGWSPEDLRRYCGVIPEALPPWLERYSRKKVPQNLYSNFLLGPKRVAVSKKSARIDAVRSGPCVCVHTAVCTKFSWKIGFLKKLRIQQ